MQRRTSSQQSINAKQKGYLGFANVLEGKLPFLIAFAAVYGLVFINYIDIASSGLNDGYHLWLVLMYFLPFASLSMLSLKNWTLTTGWAFSVAYD